MTTAHQFPSNFLWGAATAAYQIEGSPLADGAGASIWERFAHTPGMMRNGDTGDVACDHYQRWREDIALMKALRLNAYRFSIAWARVLPQGTGKVNPKGLDFYERLVDALLEAGITPTATLYHWDLPAALDDRGGWLNRDSAQWFAEYAHVMFERLDGRVKMWSTLNEPWVVMDGGYMHGALAPGHRNLYEAPIVAHNLLRAHGAAVQAYRAVGKHDIGLVFNLEPKYPHSASAADQLATRRAHAYMNRQFMDPVFRGTYDQELVRMYGAAWPQLTQQEWDADMALISQPIDFMGLNYYTRNLVRDDHGMMPIPPDRPRRTGATYTETDWEVFPQGLLDTLHWVRTRYGNPPLYITENGSAFYDPPVAEGGVVNDPLRSNYLQKHLRILHQAIAEGCDVRGYFAWSLLDNLEWSHGYSKRFGLVHVNYQTQERTIKNSGKYYADIIASNGAVLSGG